MAFLVEVPKYTDNRGAISVIESCFDFKIQRTYFIHECTGLDRGGHRHRVTKQFLLPLQGSCNVLCQSPEYDEHFTMNKTNVGLLIEPEDWHVLSHIEKNSIFAVFASEYYNVEDYILEPYRPYQNTD